jgi:hypothetical protein
LCGHGDGVRAGEGHARRRCALRSSRLLASRPRAGTVHLRAVRVRAVRASRPCRVCELSVYRPCALSHRAPPPGRVCGLCEPSVRAPSLQLYVSRPYASRSPSCFVRGYWQNGSGTVRVGSLKVESYIRRAFVQVATCFIYRPYSSTISSSGTAGGWGSGEVRAWARLRRSHSLGYARSGRANAPGSVCT